MHFRLGYAPARIVGPFPISIFSAYCRSARQPISLRPAGNRKAKVATKPPPNGHPIKIRYGSCRMLTVHAQGSEARLKTYSRALQDVLRHAAIHELTSLYPSKTNVPLSDHYLPHAAISNFRHRCALCFSGSLERARKAGTGGAVHGQVRRRLSNQGGQPGRSQSSGVQRSGACDPIFGRHRVRMECEVSGWPGFPSMTCMVHGARRILIARLRRLRKTVSAFLPAPAWITLLPAVPPGGGAAGRGSWR